MKPIVEPGAAGADGQAGAATVESAACEQVPWDASADLSGARADHPVFAPVTAHPADEPVAAMQAAAPADIALAALLQQLEAQAISVEPSLKPLRPRIGPAETASWLPA
jgi:hypothetical protein